MMIKIKDYFKFNSRERLAIILLSCLMGLFWVLPAFYPAKPLPIIPEMKEETGQKREYEEPFVGQARTAIDSNLRKLENGKLEPKKPIKYFYFDPNRIEAGQWEKLGLKSKTIATILNYRNKGGRFRKPEDIKKIWGLRPDEADRLIPYIQIEATEVATKRDYPAKDAMDKSGKEAGKESFLNKPNYALKKIDINTASQSDWEAFPGIGPVLSARIIKFRDKIGGFKTIEQVSKTYGLSDSVFQKILPYLEKQTVVPTQ
jgi:competence protein ComEA